MTELKRRSVLAAGQPISPGERFSILQCCSALVCSVGEVQASQPTRENQEV